MAGARGKSQHPAFCCSSNLRAKWCCSATAPVITCGRGINGDRVVFLLDTGATQVALSTQLARRLGLKLGAAVTLQTARGRRWATRSGCSVRLASIEMRDVSALVSDGLDPGTVLLA